jgi:hypothetical protein
MIQETRIMHNFWLLLVKPVSTRTRWTLDEICQFKSHMKHLVLCVTVIVVFILPFGLLLLPLYIEFLDRRRDKRAIDM